MKIKSDDVSHRFENQVHELINFFKCLFPLALFVNVDYNWGEKNLNPWNLIWLVRIEKIEQNIERENGKFFFNIRSVS